MTRNVRFMDLNTGRWRDLPPGEPTPDAMQLMDAIAGADSAPVMLPYPGDHAIAATISGHCLWGTLLTGGVQVARFGVALRSRCGCYLWPQMHRDAMQTVATDPDCPLVEPWGAMDAGADAPLWTADFCQALAIAWQWRRARKKF